MSTSPSYFPTKNRVRRKRKSATTSTLPLTLIAVTFDTSEGILALTFNRAIVLDGFDGEEVRLKDGVTTNMVLGPYPPVEVDGAVLSMGVQDVEPYAGSDVLLTVLPGNGIVAVDDGVEFAGVTDLEVPFP